ncbi:glycoside hydrolase family 76 protein [Nocardia sp. NPDC050406]|uniref:glycoside hydrolase family 76 protein n=1 Tax=Nocardia sp. NPDC050406 TaxID=3364318 RepID=UPI0037929FB1
MRPLFHHERPVPDTSTVSQVRQWARTITLTTAAGTATATIADGRPGDRVWLDRRTDTEQVQLGEIEVAANETAARTAAFGFEDGVLRACGRAGDRPEVRCTRWMGRHDPNPDRGLRAVERLLDRYDHENGRWGGDASVWQSANALTSLIGYMARTGDRQYVGYLDETYRHGMVSRTGLPRDTGYNDDALWWALAWLDAFDLTGEQRYLAASRTIVDSLDDQHATFCDGGLAWARRGVDPHLRPWTQVNSITNELYLTATARLSIRVESAARASYFARAQQTWEWFAQRAGRMLLDPSGLINDHLDQQGDTCVPADVGTRWTYGQGAMVSGLVAMYRATGNKARLRDADRVMAASTGAGSPFLRDGVLVESAAKDCPGPDCKDAETFKGVFVRAYRELVDTRRSQSASPYFLARQANSLPGVDDEYGFRWQAPAQPDDTPTFATQAAAIDALNAE